MLLSTAVIGLCLISSIHSEKLHQHMTSDEIRSIFNVHEDDVHKLDYEVVEILHVHPNNDHLHKRKPRMAKPQLRVKAFSQNYTLYLEENDNILLGDKTPVFLAENRNPDDNEPNIVYSKIKYPSLGNFKLYHDVEKRVAISLEHENDDRFHVNGVIGDDIVIRSLPKRIHDEVLSQTSSRSRRSSSSNDNDSRFGDAFKKTPHVFIKANMTSNPLNLESVGSPWNKNNNAFKPDWNIFGLLKSQPQKVPSTTSKPITKYILSKPKQIHFQTSNPMTNDTVYPQLLVTVDYETFKTHDNDVEKTAKYMAAFWNGVDLRFREMSSPRVRLNIAGLIIPKQASAAKYMEDYRIAPGAIYHERTLNEMGGYFFRHIKEFPLETYDIVVGITFKKLGKIDKSGNVNTQITGLAAFEGACAGREGAATVLVRDKGSYNGLTTAAHEVAHSLGAPHDGPESVTVPGGPCAWDDGYLMSYDRKDDKGMHFSNCSIRAMQDFLKRPQTRCLRNKPNTGRSYPKILPGKLVSRSEQCKRTMGNDWFAYKGEESNCALLWCQSGTEAVSELRPPAEGTRCGEGAICLNAQCVQDPELR